uniref:Ig-like domain-containing protein n=1 Tax=Astyanax mexicanus TaxID=7994 RepID=A0A3B1JCS8_ASTMX
MILNAGIICCSVFTDCSGEERVEQPVRDVTRSEGTSVTLECTYETSSNSPYLFWYIQRSHDFPKYILRRDGFSAGDNGTEFHERMSSAVQSTSVPLSIQKLSVRDSAVYYCALSSTVTSSHSPIIQKHAAAWIWRSPLLQYQTLLSTTALCSPQ